MYGQPLHLHGQRNSREHMGSDFLDKTALSDKIVLVIVIIHIGTHVLTLNSEKKVVKDLSCAMGRFGM